MTATNTNLGEEEPSLPSLYTLDALQADERAAIIEAIGVGQSVKALVDSDMLPEGRFGKSRLILCEDQIVVMGPEHESRIYPLNGIAAAQTADFVGNSQFQLMSTDGRRLTLMRYSRTRSQAFAEMAELINSELNVSESELADREEETAKVSGPREGSHTYRCPNCGHPLLSPTDSCPKCTSKRLVMGRLMQFLLAHRFTFALGCALSFLVIGINLAPAMLVRLLIDHVMTPANLTTAIRLHRLYLIVSLFFALIVLRLVTQHFRISVMGKLSAQVILDLRGKLYRSLQRLSLSYYDRTHTGRIMARVLNDTKGVQRFLVGGVQQILMHGLTVILIPIILIVENPFLAAIALAPIPIVAFVSRLFAKRFHSIFSTLRRRFATLSAQLSETISGIRVVKSFAQEEREVDGFDEKSRDVYDAHVASVKTRAVFKPSVLFMMTLGTIVVWLVGGRQVIYGALTLGVLVQFISYMNQFYNPVQSLLDLVEAFQDTAAAAERVFNIMDMPSEVADHENAIEPRNIKGRILFDDVSFKYEHGETVLKNVKLLVEPGEMIGLVGETGSGKSTLVSLICRFYEPTTGCVTLDGIDLRDIRIKSLRDNIGMVLQETFLFAGSIRENIAYGKPDATDDEVIRCSKAANAHEFIMSLPDAYDTRVGERGTGLSGGERQRIAIARAILKDPAILILDEATSSVDTITEQSIQDAMDRLVAGRTTFAIAHRLSTLRNADRLLVMERGEIKEEGSHDELMARGGKYAELVEIQGQFLRGLNGDSA